MLAAMIASSKAGDTREAIVEWLSESAGSLLDIHFMIAIDKQNERPKVIKRKELDQ